MKDLGIIYCRKSTDRIGRQQNSHYTQLMKCREVAINAGINVIEEIVESVSAKKSGKRKGFDNLMTYANSGRIDYIIIDEADRLSRDDMDTAKFITMFRDGVVKGMYIEGRLIEYDDIYAINELWAKLGWAKTDNEQRSRKVSKNMTTVILRGGVVSKFPFGYKNTIRQEYRVKAVEVIEEEADLVRRAFIMRSQGIALKEIAEFLTSETDIKWRGDRVRRMIQNKKYYGVQKFGTNSGPITAPGYKAIISEELFKAANNAVQFKTITKKKGVVKRLNGIMFGEDGKRLSADYKKGHIYYRQIPSSELKISISEKIVFEKVGEILKDLVIPKGYIRLSKEMLKDLFHEKESERVQDQKFITEQISILEARENSLQDKFLDGEIHQDMYKKKGNEIRNTLNLLKEKDKACRQDKINFMNYIDEMCELLENLYGSYSLGDVDKKTKIIKALQCELVVNTKKELTLRKSKLLEISKSLSDNKWCTQQGSNLQPTVSKTATLPIEL